MKRLKVKSYGDSECFMGETEDFDIPLFGYGGNIESQRLFQNDKEYFEIFIVLRLLKLFYILQQSNLTFLFSKYHTKILFQISLS